MRSRQANPLKAIFHPYIFVLKEGKEIKKDFLDYSLMMLFVHSKETIKSPNRDEILIKRAYSNASFG